MADYTRYKTETLLKMLDQAERKYVELTMKPKGNWGDGMRLSKLPSIDAWDRARERYYAIKEELDRRKRNGE